MIGGDNCNMKNSFASESLVTWDYYSLKPFKIMSKCKQYNVSLVTVGKLDEELHYGALGHFW